jgi:hypothetical protein
MVKHVVKWVRRMIIGITGKHEVWRARCMPSWKEQILATKNGEREERFGRRPIKRKE